MSLYLLLKACDNVLKSVEVSLASFQKDLGLVSTEIETLQSRSTAMNTRLENRKVVEKLMGPALEEITVSPTTVRVISESPIDENWIKALSDLERRLDVISAKMRAANTIRAVTDIKPLLDNLSNKVRSQLLVHDIYETLTCILLGCGAYTRLPCRTDQSFTITYHQCSDHTTTNSSQIQNSLWIPC